MKKGDYITTQFILHPDNTLHHTATHRNTHLNTHTCLGGFIEKGDEILEVAGHLIRGKNMPEFGVLLRAGGP